MADIPYRLRAEGWEEGARGVRDFGAALDDARASADEASDSAEDFGAKTNDAAEEAADFGAGLRGLVGVAGGAAAALTAAAAAAAAWGNAVETSMGVFNRLPGSVRPAQDAVGGMVSRMELAIARNRLMQSGLALSDQQFADLAEVATDYAAAVGGNATQAMEQLGDAVRTLSGEGLGRFGVSIDTTKSRADQLAQAMAQLRLRADGMTTGADTAGGAWGRFHVILQDATTEAQRASDVVSNELAPSFNELARAITGSSEATLEWQDISRTTEDLFVSLVAAIGAGTETIVVAAGRAIEGWRSFFRLLNEGFGAIASGRNPLEVLSNLGPILDRVAQQQASVRGTESLTSIFEAALDRNLRAIVDDRRSGGRGGLSEPTGPLRPPGTPPRSSGQRDLRSAAERVEDMLAAQEGAEAAEAAMAAEERAARLAGASTRTTLDNWLGGLDKAAEATRRATEESARMRDTQKELEESATRAADAFRDSWRSGVDAVIEALNEANEAAQKAGTTQIGVFEGMAQAAHAAGAQMSDALLGGLANAFAGAVKAAVAGEKGFGEALAGMLEDVLFSVGTQATVLSLMELGRAVADAASFNAAGAAAHAAAAAIFAGVAALAFAGGAGIAAASAGGGASAGAAAAPASPQPANDNSSGSTNIYNINFSGQVVTASTHAELGRELESAIGQSRSRWGRAA